ncbi:MAG: hypothetical protein HC886_00405 [Leptolyngbyaceae cyanobacterium SM1_1_3]|nr:hypothetical protein [Leptolyngbyaceae cyanobacterium SM1_1_3]NJN03973.1 hypothetical protein [Leptolyngbyaceae cyanobacterium RM1_1_2]NJO09079.1 hypothetical protein [Leptolyngbyaceae cyanobacterium SL_1_1]
MNNQSCPCCGHVLLRHVRSSGPYWVCTDCWQEMPIIEAAASTEPEILDDVAALEEAFRVPTQSRENSAEETLQSL